VDFENGLKERVRAAGLADRILFVGEHTNINEWYRALDLFIAPQRWEGFGLTPLEAMSTGVPVIATDVGAFPELVRESETGTVIGRDNLDAMVEATSGFLSDTEMMQHRSAVARRTTVENFALEGEARSLGNIYARV
jgi:mannosyltransferase